MTQEEFNSMLQVAIAQGLPGGYYTSKYSGEEIDALLDLVSEHLGPGQQSITASGSETG